MHNVPSMQSLAVQCDGLHEHLKWGFNNNKWPTAEEVEYPHKLCTAIADCVRQQLFSIGVLPLPQDLATSLSQDFDTRQTQVGANLQPRGRCVKPLVREFSAVARARSSVSPFGLPSGAFARDLPDHSSPYTVTLSICLQMRATSLEGWPVLVVYCSVHQVTELLAGVRF